MNTGHPYELQLMETAKRRAVALRQAAITDAMTAASHAPSTLLHALWQRVLRLTGGTPCRS